MGGDEVNEVMAMSILVNKEIQLRSLTPVAVLVENGLVIVVRTKTFHLP